jgi:hypothetical protein
MNMLRVGDHEPVELDGRVLAALDTLDEVMKEIEESKLSPRRDPPEGDMPVMPTNLSAEPPSELGKLFTTLLAWQNFVAAELAIAQAAELQNKNKYTYVKAKLKKEGVAKDELELHPVMLEVLTDHQRAKQRVLVIEATRKNISKNIDTVSRSIELRKIEFYGDRRGGNLDVNSTNFISDVAKDAEEDKIKWKQR